jgi:hypothetical protein
VNTFAFATANFNLLIIINMPPVAGFHKKTYFFARIVGLSGDQTICTIWKFS